MKEVKYDPQIYIAQNDAKFYSQSARKASNEIKAMPALAAVVAVKAVAEVKDKDGKVTTPAVQAVKAVKAREVIKAAASRDAEIYPRIAAKSEVKLMQLIARMALEGVLVKPGEEPESNDKGICISFVVPNLPKFRLAFKQAKGEGKHNKEASALFAADAKAKAAKETEAKKAKEKAAKDAEEKKNPKKEEKKKEADKEAGDAWAE